MRTPSLSRMRPGARSAAWPVFAGLLPLLALPPAGALGSPSFHDATAEAGLGYLQHAGQQAPDCIFFGSFCEPERMSGGAAVGDVDGDGWPDLYVTRVDAPDILFRNEGDGTFEDFTQAAGLAGFDVQSNGAAFADIDRDGDLDLYVSVLGEASDPVNNRNYLFVNQGDGTFVEDAVARGAAIATGTVHRGYGVSFGDYDRDGWVDLHVTEWLPQGVSSNSRLLHNLGPASPGVFEDATAAAGVGLEGRHGFASAFVDLDGDGWQDLAVAADFGTSRLFWNDGDGTFTDGTSAAGVGTDENGMGSTFGDYDGDGDLDWFVTSIHDPAQTCQTQICSWGYTGNRLYRYEGGRSFSDATDAAGVRAGFWGWGTAFFDYDNDGDLDLVMTNGVDFPDSTVDDLFNADPMRFWENDGAGVFTERSCTVGLTDTGSGKGLLVFDYDLDGDLDLFIVDNAGQPVLYRNDGGNARGWLRVRTVGRLSNREGRGARVTIQPARGDPVQVREIGASTHYLGQSERIAHFGLGQGGAPVYRVWIEWPSGNTQEIRNAARRTTITAIEPFGVPSVQGSGLLLLAALIGAGGASRTSGRAREASGRRRLRPSRLRVGGFSRTGSGPSSPSSPSSPARRLAPIR